MTAQLIDGNALSKQLRTQVAADTAKLKAQGLTPGLAVVLVGDNPASQVYVRNKVKACEEAGLHSVLEKYEASMTEADLLARVEALNNDPSIHGILVQLPLPAHIDAQKVIEAISPAKDVDGFHAMNLGALQRTAHAFGASFVFTIGADDRVLHTQADTSKASTHVPLYHWRSLAELKLVRVRQTPWACAPIE